MINKIIGITGCLLGITGCVANIVANNKIKKLSVDMENHVNYMHSSEQSIENRIGELNNRLNKVVENSDKMYASINCIYDSIDDVKETIAENNHDNIRDVVRNEISDNNEKIYKAVNRKFNDVALDIINMNTWGKGVNAAIEQLEIAAEKSNKDFKPIIKSMLDERRNVTAEASTPTAETTVAATTETPTETAPSEKTETKTESTPETNVENKPVSNNKKKANK